MNYFDLLLTIPLIWGAYKGFTKGLIIELASLAGLILGLYLGVRFSSYTSSILVKYIEINSDYLPIISFAITFLGVVLLVFLLAKILEKVINFIALKLVNKIAGACFGLLKYAVIFSALLFVFDTIDNQIHLVPENQKTNSKLYPIIQPIVPTLVPGIKDFDMMRQIKKSVPEIIIL